MVPKLPENITNITELLHDSILRLLEASAIPLITSNIPQIIQDSIFQRLLIEGNMDLIRTQFPDRLGEYESKISIYELYKRIASLKEKQEIIGRSGQESEEINELLNLFSVLKNDYSVDKVEVISSRIDQLSEEFTQQDQGENKLFGLKPIEEIISTNEYLSSNYEAFPLPSERPLSVFRLRSKSEIGFIINSATSFSGHNRGSIELRTSENGDSSLQGHRLLFRSFSADHWPYFLTEHAKNGLYNYPVSNKQNATHEEMQIYRQQVDSWGGTENHDQFYQNAPYLRTQFIQALTKICSTQNIKKLVFRMPKRFDQGIWPKAVQPSITTVGAELIDVPDFFSKSQILGAIEVNPKSPYDEYVEIPRLLKFYTWYEGYDEN